MPEKQSVDLLIEARWVLPIAPVNVALSNHAVAVQDGRIAAVGPTTDLLAAYEPREHIVRGEHALLPGFVNAHTQSAAVLLRGLPVRFPALRWLQETVAPVEERWMNPDFVRDGTQLAIAEMLRAGITTFGDRYSFPEEAARVAAQARMRAAIGLPISESPTPWAENLTAHLAKSERLWDEYKADPHVCLYFAPEPAYRLSDTALARVRIIADELEARVAVPLHETEVEVRDAIAQDGRRPLQRLADLGLLRPGFAAVQMNRLDETDLELLARTGIAVIACPQAGLRLGSGFCPLPELLARGIVTGLGTGNPAASGAIDLLAELRTAALLASGFHGGPAALSPEAALHMATLGSASALGMAGEIGSLEVGKAADLIAIDLGTLPCQPAHAPLNALVFAASRQQVSDVWIGGRAAVSNGRLLTFDEQELLALAQSWEKRLSAGVSS